MQPYKNCLVIDDDPAFAAVVQRVAQSLGFTVSIVTDATRLEDALSNGEPDVITLDLEMPRRSGFEVLIALELRRLTDRVVIISGAAHLLDDMGSRFDRRTIAAVLSKPARKREIEAALKIALSRGSTDS